MRRLNRMGLGLVGLALLAPPVACADPPYADPLAVESVPPRRSLFHREHLCTRCQRADIEARGLAVPPPPALPKEGVVPTKHKCDRCGAPIMMMSASAVRRGLSTPTYSPSPGTAWTSVPPSVAPPPPALASSPPLVPGMSSAPAWASVPATVSPVVAAATAPQAQERPASKLARLRTRARSDAASMMASTGNPADCPTCGDSTPGAMASNGAPGRAVAGGGAAGLAVAGGTIPSAEPTPIGVIQGRYAYQNPSSPMGAADLLATGGQGRPGANTGGPGSSDPSVKPTSFAPDPYDPVGHNRPHILSHLFGLDAIGRHSREERERINREKHASIPYQSQPEQKVDELPSKMVYGR